MEEENLIREWLSIITVLAKEGERPDKALRCQQAPRRCVWVGSSRPSESASALGSGSALCCPVS